MTAESPAQNVRSALQQLYLARHGQTATGHPARLLTDDEFTQLEARLWLAVRQLEGFQVPSSAGVYS